MLKKCGKSGFFYYIGVYVEKNLKKIQKMLLPLKLSPDIPIIFKAQLISGIEYDKVGQNLGLS
jgi:hypothetical protein